MTLTTVELPLYQIPNLVALPHTHVIPDSNCLEKVKGDVKLMKTGQEKNLSVFVSALHNY